MATYHFRIKSDKKPDGTRISAVTHAEYIGREGKFSDIDRKESLRQSLAGNFITTKKVRDAFDGKYIPLYYTDDYGSIANTCHGITLTENPSMETLAIALSLADEALGHQPLIVRGSEKFKRKVMEAAVLSELRISFADEFMQQEFQQKLEEAEDERREFRKHGGKYISRRYAPKPGSQSLFSPSSQSYANRGLCLPTLSERHLVIPETRNDVGVFLQGDGIRDLDREAKKLRTENGVNGHFWQNCGLILPGFKMMYWRNTVSLSVLTTVPSKHNAGKPCKMVIPILPSFWTGYRKNTSA